MKKTIQTLFIATLITAVLAGCAKAGGNSAQSSSEAVSAADSSEAASAVEIANPWREVSEKEELETLLGTTITVPEGAENVIYQIMDSEGLCEASFFYQDHDCTYRIKKADLEEDISGMYYGWNEIETVSFYGCEATYRKCTEDGEDVELASWYNTDRELMYSLSAVGSGDSFDLWDVADHLYEIPDDIQTASGLNEEDPYRDILAGIRNALENEESQYLNDTGLMGLQEVVGGYGTEQTLQMVGYFMQDIDGNGVEELIVAVDEPDYYEYPRILAIYTVQNGGTIQLIEGWYRNRYFLLDGGRVLNQGSSGAYNNVVGVYQIDDNGTDMKVVEFYFSEPVTDDKGELTTEWYFNTVGEYDVAVSEKVTDEELTSNTYEQYDQEIFRYELTPLP